ncbi:MAG: 2-C-methyl-D-erythritol 2,4-cyclodiphosphate synthase [Planctomycetales bacterium]|nr:2-C-methyl-D-erythritol 2,4-cyclodiphosphate synthase [Planctomycetales bacterium]
MASSFRIGLGEDSHRTTDGGPLRIGGVDVPHSKQLVGHSDADVLLHAVTDAVLGAAGLPDIGHMFPNTEEGNRNRDSADMLRLAYDRVVNNGYRLVNLDCVVSAQEPKLGPHRETIAQRIADILEVDAVAVNVKAKTGEGLGEIGRGELIAARCVALIEMI